MIIEELRLQHFRNFTQLSIQPHPRLNLIYGQNGSGKTNLLEAIYHLSTGKSFRNKLAKQIIQHEQARFSIKARLKGASLPYELRIDRDAEGAHYQLNQTPAQTIDLIYQLPLRLIYPDSFSFLTGAPSFRRQLLNWGVFHVEHQFWAYWKQLQRVLKQRTAALKLARRNEVIAWDKQLCELSECLLPLYQRYLEDFTPLFEQLCQQFLPKQALSLHFQPGWLLQEGLQAQLQAYYPKDQQRARTHVGPHRADLKIRSGKHAAKEVLSRGQQKLLVTALLLAQGLLLKQLRQQNCIYLLDDLAAELDEANLAKVCRVLEEIDAQIFITAPDRKLCETLFSKQHYLLFHVEQLTRSEIEILEA